MATKAANTLADDLQEFLNKGRASKTKKLSELEDNIKFISTGIKQLDYIISNRRRGGLAKIALLLGENSSGKSLIAQKACAQVQKAGGVAIYLDTENALNPEFARKLGVDIDKLMVEHPDYIEDAFDYIEKVIDFIRTKDKSKPILIVWDSIAATPSKDESQADYDDKFMASGARAMSQGFRKINKKLADSNVCLLLVNQLRTNIGVMYGDNTMSSHGKAMMYYPSIIIRLTLSNLQQEGTGENKEGTSVDVTAKIVKNRFGPPHRKCEFTVSYTKGPIEGEQILRKMNTYPHGDFNVTHEGKPAKLSISNSAWKKVVIYDPKVNPLGDDKKEFIKMFRTQDKEEFYAKVIHSKEYESYMDEVLDQIYIKSYDEIDEEYKTDGSGFDPESQIELDILNAETEK